jgi:hypothetical protein
VGLTRREVLAGAAAGALGAAGVYELVDRLTSGPARPGVARRAPEQHVLEGLRVVRDEGVEVVVPPLHHQVVTARLRVSDDSRALRSAREGLEEVLAGLEGELEATPAGLGVTVAWGLPYFRRYVPALAERELPLDLRASRARGHEVGVLIDAIRFPSDPSETLLEENDVAVMLRSDRQEHVARAAKEIFTPLGDVFEMTSVRKGFAGGGFDGQASLPKRMAMAAGISGAELIPETAELFLGFTSTQQAALGPSRIANMETLHYSKGGYFRRGTHMHLSHVFEDVEAWYLNFDFRERVDTLFRPNQPARAGARTLRQAPQNAVTSASVRRDFRRFGAIGHSAAIQPTSRLQEDVVGADGTIYPKGTAVPQRADFNTLDNPFFWSARPDADGWSEEPSAGVHFVVFNPTSDDFHRNRLAMDGVLPDGTRLPFQPRDRGQGINSVLRTTHRQNFIVPPRRHRSFPLADLIA